MEVLPPRSSHATGLKRGWILLTADQPSGDSVLVLPQFLPTNVTLGETFSFGSRTALSHLQSENDGRVLAWGQGRIFLQFLPAPGFSEP